jgi:hypothetical protein
VLTLRKSGGLASQRLFGRRRDLRRQAEQANVDGSTFARVIVESGAPISPVGRKSRPIEVVIGAATVRVPPHHPHSADVLGAALLSRAMRGRSLCAVAAAARCHLVIGGAPHRPGNALRREPIGERAPTVLVSAILPGPLRPHGARQARAPRTAVPWRSSVHAPPGPEYMPPPGPV